MEVKITGATTSGDTSLLSLESTQLNVETKIGSLTETAPATDTASSGLNGRMQRLAQRLTSLIALLPSSLGQKTTAGSLSVTLSSDHGALPLPTGAATSAKQDTLQTAIDSVNTKTPALGQALAANSTPVTLTALEEGLFGALTETAPATDTASSGLNGRMQRVAQRLTSLIALLPTGLGSAAASASLAVTASTEDVARQGIITETAPATDTASSGQNGRLQRIAQRLTSLIALFPTALGSAAASASLAVTASTEDVARMGIITEGAPASDTASSGLNGRMQRIAQRLTTLLAVFPTTLDTNSGSKSASTLRVVLATDQPQLTAKLLVTPDANSAVNVAQINGVTPLMGAGNTGTGAQRTTTSSAGTATLTNVSSSASTGTILASNAARLGATFYNDSTQVCYLKFGATASTTSYTVQMAAGAYYELPGPHVYSGIIDGIWASANGSMRVTELT
jgi:hypothetical protein